MQTQAPATLGGLDASTDVAIVGAGILGLAHAAAAVKRGLRVTVFERSDIAVGASIRNFGQMLVTGQPPGCEREMQLALSDSATKLLIKLLAPGEELVPVPPEWVRRMSSPGRSACPLPAMIKRPSRSLRG